MPETIQPAAGQLENVSESGEVPKSRLATAEAARSMLSGLIEADIPAAIDRTRIQKHIDGAPPFTRDELEKAGQGWRANVPWGAARARIRDYLVAFHDIITSTNVLPNVKVKAGDIRQRATWGQKISQRFHALLFASYNDWDFIKEMHMHQKQLAVHGIGPCFRRQARDWRFHAMKRRNILVPRDSPADISRIPVAFVRDVLYVHELYAMIRGDKAKTNWNKTAAFAAIKGAQIKADDKFNMEVAEEMWKDNQYDWGLNKSTVVKVAHVFVREFNGISHHLFTEDAVADYKPAKEDTGYIYSEVGKLKDIGERLWVCFQEIGNGDFESVRGLGMEAHLFGQMNDRLNNGLADNGLAAGAVMWQAESPEAADKMTRSFEIGPHRIIPTGLQKVDVSTGAGVQAQLAVSNHFSQQESATTGGFRTRATTPSNQERTATEVEAEIGETSKLSNASVADYCIQADKLIEASFRIATSATLLDSDPGGPAALEMKRLLIEEDGIPEEMFHEICATACVTITRPIGNGSYADRVSRLSRIGQFIGDMPDRKRRQFVRDNIAYIGGDRELADTYGPDLEDENPGLERSLAILENNGFQGGGQQDPFSPDNSHAVHFPTHYEFAMQLLKGDPQKSVPILNIVGPHMNEHLEALRNDPTRRSEFKQFNKQFSELMKMVDRARQMAEMAANSQQQAQQSPEMMESQATIALKGQETQADIARKDAKAQQQMAVKDATTAQNMRLKELQAEQQRALMQAQSESAKASQSKQ